MRLTLLGTGTPSPRLDRAGSSYLVEASDERLLFDCGPNCVYRLLQAGIAPAEIERLFLTHLHYDHCVDYSHLVLCRWSEPRETAANLRVTGPVGTRRMTDLLFGPDGVWAADVATRPPAATGNQWTDPCPAVAEVGHGATVEGNGWRVHAAEVEHFRPHLVALAYRIEAGERSIVLGGDSGPSGALVALAGGADVLVHMSYYLDGTEVSPQTARFCSSHLDAARTAQAARAGTLILVHVDERIDRPDVLDRMVTEARAVFDGQVIAGRDLQTIPV